MTVHINEVNLQIEENYARTQEKQLELFERDIKIN
jgi:hypothetical protein